MPGRCVGVVVVALSLAACGAPEDARVRDNSSAVSLTDSQIAGVLVAASQDALAAARIVADRGGPEACDYGSQMMVMHSAAMDRMHAIGVRPTPSEVGVVLDYDTKKVIAEIGKATGRVAVDLLYLCLQVRAQTTVAELPMQAVVTGRAAVVLPVTEQGATVGTASVSISVEPNVLSILGTGLSNPPVNTNP